MAEESNADNSPLPPRDDPWSDPMPGNPKHFPIIRWIQKEDLTFKKNGDWGKFLQDVQNSNEANFEAYLEKTGFLEFETHNPSSGFWNAFGTMNNNLHGGKNRYVKYWNKIHPHHERNPYEEQSEEEEKGRSPPRFDPWSPILTGDPQNLPLVRWITKADVSNRTQHPEWANFFSARKTVNEANYEDCLFEMGLLGRPKQGFWTEFPKIDDILRKRKMNYIKAWKKEQQENSSQQQTETLYYQPLSSIAPRSNPEAERIETDPAEENWIRWITLKDLEHKSGGLNYDYKTLRWTGWDDYVERTIDPSFKRRLQLRRNSSIRAYKKFHGLELSSSAAASQTSGSRASYRSDRNADRYHARSRSPGQSPPRVLKSPAP